VRIAILGLSITSSWGNGHATTYRSLARALKERGHEIIFFERNLEWYASNRDMPEPEFCRVHVYENWEEVRPLVRRELANCDVGMVGSYFPDAAEAIEELFGSRAPVKAFYDIDTPITLAKLRSGDTEYLSREQVPGFDLYLSFTGGPSLVELEAVYGAQRAVPLYCSFDPEKYRNSHKEQRFACDLSYMGTYAPDRQPKLDELFCTPASRLPQSHFLLAGPQYPPEISWPANVKHVIHLEPKFHPPFYSSSRFTLNVTREEMVSAGYSPSVRLFEAAGCGAAIISDVWPGLESFFVPAKEILLAASAEEVVSYMTGLEPSEIRFIGRNAQERVIAEHSSERRAKEFERYVETVTANSTLLTRS
jgi:spore maturation protein CgeB